MELRTAISQALNDRAAIHLPASAQTMWGERPIVTVIEQLSLSSVDLPADDAPFQIHASYQGFVICELFADAIDDLALEPLLASLATQRLQLNPADDLAPGSFAHKAYAMIDTLRDAVRDARIVHQLRFKLAGHIVSRIDPAARPELMVGIAPSIGPEFESSYRPLAAALETGLVDEGELA